MDISYYEGMAKGMEIQQEKDFKLFKEMLDRVFEG